MRKKKAPRALSIGDLVAPISGSHSVREVIEGHGTKQEALELEAEQQRAEIAALKLGKATSELVARALAPAVHDLATKLDSSNSGRKKGGEIRGKMKSAETDERREALREIATGLGIDLAEFGTRRRKEQTAQIARLAVELAERGHGVDSRVIRRDIASIGKTAL